MSKEVSVIWSELVFLVLGVFDFLFVCLFGGGGGRKNKKKRLLIFVQINYKSIKYDDSQIACLLHLPQQSEHKYR